MAAFDPATLDRWRALAIVDRDGTTVGTISEFYLDRETGDPTWALVDTGLFGAIQTFVPLIHATEIVDGLQVPYEKSHIKDAPRLDLHDELSPAEEAILFAHYGVEYQPLTEADPERAGAEPPGPVRAEPEDAGPAPDATMPGSAPIAPEPDPVGTDGDHLRQGAANEAVPDEPGTVDPDATRAGAPRFGSATQPPDEPTVPVTDPPASGSERGPADLHGPGPAGSTPGDPDPLDRDADDPGLRDPDADDAHDPHLSRTAPVEPGLPGSTAAFPYGPALTVEKGADPFEAPVQAPGEAGWAPGAAGGFEEQEPGAFDRPGASDRWREAKLAAERDRIARAAAAQPEERSPLERARRRLERLVGGGQDHPDDISTTDREAAERARRARLGLDEDDRRR